MVVQFVMIQVKFGVFRWYRRHIMQKQPIPPVRGHKQKIVSYTGILLDSFSSFRKSWNETTHTPTMATLLRAWRYSRFLKHSGRSSSYFSVEMSTFSHVFLFKESHDKGLITLSSAQGVKKWNLLWLLLGFFVWVANNYYYFHQEHCGWLRKQGGRHRSLRSRWFEIKGDQLYYYRDNNVSSLLTNRTHNLLS